MPSSKKRNEPPARPMPVFWKHPTDASIPWSDRKVPTWQPVLEDGSYVMSWDEPVPDPNRPGGWVVTPKHPKTLTWKDVTQDSPTLAGVTEFVHDAWARAGLLGKIALVFGGVSLFFLPDANGWIQVAAAIVIWIIGFAREEARRKRTREETLDDGVFRKPRRLDPGSYRGVSNVGSRHDPSSRDRLT